MKNHSLNLQMKLVSTWNQEILTIFKSKVTYAKIVNVKIAKEYRLIVRARAIMKSTYQIV